MAQERRSVAVIALGIAILFVFTSVAPLLSAHAAATDNPVRGRVSGSAPVIASSGADSLAPPVPTVSGTGDPGTDGNACITPPKNTLGFTCSGAHVFQWQWDYQGSFDISVDMGDLANYDKVSGSHSYKMQLLNLAAVAWYWYDANGAYNPITDPNCSGGGRYLCDDPELTPSPFDIFKLKVNGQDFVTQQGWNEQILAENDRFFEFKPIGNDPAGTYHVPSSMIHKGINTITIEPLDSYGEYAAHMPYHSQYADGWEVNVPAVQIQLVAPPTVISHGWAVEWDPVTAVADWEAPLADAFRTLAGQQFAQDPWSWTKDDFGDASHGIFLNSYDGKQSWRYSAIQLKAKVNSYWQSLGYSGKGWLVGHSMGGIVSRSYVEEFGGSSQVDHIVTFDTPHLGSPFADFYTKFFWNLYKGNDDKLTAHYSGFDPCTPTVTIPKLGIPLRSSPLATFLYWRDWWNPSIGANTYQCFGFGRDHLADFGIKPSGVNQVFTDPITGLFTIHTMPSNKMLDDLNARYPASGVKYFALVGITGGLKDTSLALLLQTIGDTGYFRGDAIVPDYSEDMNGAIPSREVSPVTHMDVTSNADAQKYAFRSLYGLDLDTGDDPNAPSLPAGGATVQTAEVPRVTAIPKAADPIPTTEGDVVFVQKTDLVNGAWDQTVTIDPSVRGANFTVWTRLDSVPLNVTLIDPDGVEHTKAVGVEDRDFMYGESHDGTPLKARTYYVTAPAPGAWTIRVRPLDDIPQDGLPLYATAVVDSPLSLIAGADRDRVRGGETVGLRATVLTNGVPTAGASVTADYVDENGVSQSVTLFDDGAHGDAAANDGLYANSITAPSLDGELGVRITATGGTTATSFARVKTIPIFIASMPDLTLSPSDIVTSPAKPWAGDVVTANVTVHNIGERDTSGLAILLEDAGTVLATLTSNATVPKDGAATFALSFTSPTHPVTLAASVVPYDVELDTTNDAASVALGNVPIARTVASVAGPRGDGDWFVGPVTVTLGPWHGLVSSTATIFASVDGGPGAPYTSPLVFATDGRHTVDFHATDTLGDVEPTRTLSFGIDTVAPAVALASPAPGTVNALVLSLSDVEGYTFVAGPVQLNVAASDATSGLARLDVFVDGQPVASTTAAGASGYQYLWDSTTTSTGNHVLTVVVHDAAGLTASASQHVYVLVSRTVTVDHDPNATVARLKPQQG